MKITDILDAKLNLRMEAMDLEHDVKMIGINKRIKELFKELDELEMKY